MKTAPNATWAQALAVLNAGLSKPSRKRPNSAFIVLTMADARQLSAFADWRNAWIETNWSGNIDYPSLPALIVKRPAMFLDDIEAYYSPI